MDTITTSTTDTVDGLDVTLTAETPDCATDEFSMDIKLETTEIADVVNVAIVLDTSGSTQNSSGSDVDGDGTVDDYLEAQVFAAQELFQNLIDAGYDVSTTTVTLVEYNSGGNTLGNFTLDELDEFSTALGTLDSGGGTYFDRGLDEVLDAWDASGADADADGDGNTDASNFVYFMSDGYASSRSNHADEVAELAADYDATLIGIAIGSNSSEDDLNEVDTTSDGAVQVTDVSQIADVVTAPAEGAAFDGFEVYVNGVLYETISADDPRVTTDVSGYSLNDYEVTGYDYVIGDDLEVEVRASFDSGADVVTVSSITVPMCVCFVDGTMILTLKGMIAIEDLTIGDMVVTRDRGAQPIRWIGATPLTPSFVSANASLQPVLIKANAFGPDKPMNDMRVSRQHRFLLSGWQAEMMFGEAEVLAPAHMLVNDDTIRLDTPTAPFSYHHMVFDHHEVVYAEGVETESFHPTKATVDALAPAQREELFKIFPQLENMGEHESAFESARVQLKGHEGKLAARH